MRVQDGHRFRADFADPKGRLLGSAWLRPDWTPAVEYSHLAGVRAGRLPFTLSPPPAVIEPVWDDELGPPHVGYLEVSFPRADAPLAVRLPLQILREAAQEALAPLVDGTRLKPGDPFVYQVTAYPAPRPATAARDALGLEVLPDPDPLAAQSMADLLAAAEPRGEAVWDPRDLPVFIAGQVLDEAAAHATRAGAHEAAGVLLGRLLWDPHAAALYLEVTAQVPAREALADEASFTFTRATWAAVEAALALRDAGERIVGWHHSHPRAVWPCASCQCPPERRGDCPARHGFFSQKDVHLHRTVFQGAFNVALVASFHADPLPRLDLFGWRWYGVAARGFYRVGEPDPVAGGDRTSSPGPGTVPKTGREAGGQS